VQQALPELLAEAQRLPAAAYRLWRGGRTAQPTELTRFRLASGEALDLGVVHAPETGDVVVVANEALHRLPPKSWLGLVPTDAVRGRLGQRFHGGSATFDDVPAGRYRLTFQANGCATAHRFVDVVAGERVRVDLPIRSGTMQTFELTTEDGDVALALEVRDARGDVVVSKFGATRCGLLKQWARLEPGDYSLHIRRSDEPTASPVELAFSVATERASEPLRAAIP